MKKKLFSKGLYLEGVKQLRLTGIIVFVIFALEAVLVPVGKVASSQRLNITEMRMDPLLTHPILIFTFVLVAPVLTLSLFGFLNKRNKSDFYHSQQLVITLKKWLKAQNMQWLNITRVILKKTKLINTL